ncbi:hypothetical protein ABH15_13195 [Methanoculleus taiwanensis]|uniref:Archaeal Type IV pilin N-terminal domain-containing protein n=1 Tax=Methanoculleus taiwanensis TaxID=1550565 RepID=A0A498GYB2_9EURY|nr:type IV pilin N-terminal domain-containing protein [Methanoculleus taiwanensis]RXE55167.1 hypothetical protein ABH15_13195 [Methanoculleus taiwanensis]
MKFKNDHGISGNIGVMLIVTVAVIGIAVVGVTVTSQDTPDEIPNVDIIIGCDQCNATHYNITLFHNGGDTISAGEFEIQAFNADGEEITVTSCSGSSDDVWSIGDTTTFVADDEPASIKIMYTTGSAAAMLKSLDLGMPGDEEELPSPDVFVDETGTSTPTPTPTPPAGQDEMLILYACEKSAGSVSGSFMFTVSGSGWLKTHGGGSPYSGALNEGEEITVRTSGNAQVNVVGTADQLTVFSVSGSQLYVDVDGVQRGGHLSSLLIDGYRDFSSALTLSSQGHGNSYTMMYVGGDQVLACSNDPPVILTNIRPADSGLFFIDTHQGNGQEAVFMGTAEKYSIDGDETIL